MMLRAAPLLACLSLSACADTGPGDAGIEVIHLIVTNDSGPGLGERGDVLLFEDGELSCNLAPPPGPDGSRGRPVMAVATVPEFYPVLRAFVLTHADPADSDHIGDGIYLETPDATIAAARAAGFAGLSSPLARQAVDLVNAAMPVGTCLRFG